MLVFFETKSRDSNWVLLFYALRYLYCLYSFKICRRWRGIWCIKRTTKAKRNIMCSRNSQPYWFMKSTTALICQIWIEELFIRRRDDVINGQNHWMRSSSIDWVSREGAAWSGLTVIIVRVWAKLFILKWWIWQRFEEEKPIYYFHEQKS